MTSAVPTFDIVVPTVGRPCLADLLAALATPGGGAARPERIILVDDRPRSPAAPLLSKLPPGLPAPVEVVISGGTGPAAARNRGWQASSAEWIAFLDDDVVPQPGWLDRLAADLAVARCDIAGTQGRITVPLPLDRKATDWERNVAGLEQAQWATADLAYRSNVLAAVGGFDERFSRAYREDADLGLRITAAGHRITPGTRTVRHPVRPASPRVSVRLQAGNADDALMTAVHGRGWRRRAGVPQGRRPWHLVITAAGVAALAGLLSARRRLAAAAAAGWLCGTAELAWARIAPGPRTAAEVATMAATSAVLPPVATYHWVRGWLRTPALLREGRSGLLPPALKGRSGLLLPALKGRSGPGLRPAAVLLDRDGTLVMDIPYNGDAGRVTPVPGARKALDRLRAAGVPMAVVSNQSGVGRGLISRDQVDAVNEKVEALLGPLGPWLVCPHAPEDGCDCRKPAAGLVHAAAAALGVEPSRCAVIGDIGADMEAARAAGARGVLVPTPVTRPEEVATAPEVAKDLAEAVDILLGPSGPTEREVSGPVR